MIRLSRFADYGIVLVTHIAGESSEVPMNARSLAEASNLPAPTVSKVLKRLARAGILRSHRGKQGGYTLARPAESISVAQMVAAVDGPINLTECGNKVTGPCDLEPSCPVMNSWQRISDAVRNALQELTLADLVAPGLCREVAHNAGQKRHMHQQLVELRRR